jgi:2-dehydro-3-deoxy-D-arabinonate dehydratase
MGNSPQFVRFFRPGLGVRSGLRVGDQVHDVSGAVSSFAQWLQVSAGRIDAAIQMLMSTADATSIRFPVADFDRPPTADQPHWLAPVDTQDVWAAGVTYERSRDARQVEAVDGGDVYSRVYHAERPELFFKAHGSEVIGPHGQVGIRADAMWSVPEPELAIVINPNLEVVGLTVGNDMSSRDIEGANPLYLPQAKVYTGSCALGPGIVLGEVRDWPETTIRLRVERQQQAAFEGSIDTRHIHRTLGELVSYLGRCHHFPDGVVLLTGTGIVPPPDFTLQPGDIVQITIETIGTLRNVVQTV